MLNTFASLQHINQSDFQAAWGVLEENLESYKKHYSSKEDFVNEAHKICSSFDDEPRLGKEDNEAIAAKVWDALAE